MDTKIAFGEEFKIPKVILDYLVSVATCVTPSDDHIAVNQSRITVPQGRIAERQVKGAATSGSFGYIDKYTYNAYECRPIHIASTN